MENYPSLAEGNGLENRQVGVSPREGSIPPAAIELGPLAQLVRADGS